MVLFNLFGSKPKDVESSPILKINSDTDAIEEDKPDEAAKKDEEKRMITITWGTGMPIDVIFNYIHKNFEEEGFQDALVNSEIVYREAKERIIRNDLEMLFRRIILRYNNDIREIEVNIDNAQKAYALTAVGKLQARRETYEEHLKEIHEMQRLLLEDDPKMTTMIESYRRGFQKGIASKAISFING